MLRQIFVLLCFLTFAGTRAFGGAVPPDLQAALQTYRAEGAANWAFDQTTSAQGVVLAEHFDPSKTEFARWTLLSKNGAPPSEKEVIEYRERLSRRTSGTAPNVKDQLDLDSCEQMAGDDVRTTFRFRLKPGAKEDRSAGHMQAFFTLHRATGAIERVEIASFDSFSPMFAVKISEARTVIVYSLPSQDRPSLLQSVNLRVRGRVMWVRSLDADMDIVFSKHTFVGKIRSTVGENPARAETTSP